MSIPENQSEKTLVVVIEGESPRLTVSYSQRNEAQLVTCDDFLESQKAAIDHVLRERSHKAKMALLSDVLSALKEQGISAGNVALALARIVGPSNVKAEGLLDQLVNELNGYDFRSIPEVNT